MCIKSDRCQIGCGEVSQAVCSALNTAAQRQVQKIITSLEVKCHFHMLTALLISLFICMSRNSLLFIATRPYDGRNHLRIAAEARGICILQNVPTVSRTNPNFFSVSARVLSGKQTSLCVKLTTHLLLLVPGLRMIGAKPLLSLYTFVA